MRRRLFARVTCRKLCYRWTRLSLYHLQPASLSQRMSICTHPSPSMHICVYLSDDVMEKDRRQWVMRKWNTDTRVTRIRMAVEIINEWKGRKRKEELTASLELWPSFVSLCVRLIHNPRMQWKWVTEYQSLNLFTFVAYKGTLLMKMCPTLVYLSAAAFHRLSPNDMWSEIKSNNSWKLEREGEGEGERNKWKLSQYHPHDDYIVLTNLTNTVDSACESERGGEGRRRSVLLLFFVMCSRGCIFLFASWMLLHARISWKLPFQHQ